MVTRYLDHKYRRPTRFRLSGRFVEHRSFCGPANVLKIAVASCFSSLRRGAGDGTEVAQKTEEFELMGILVGI
jgi:hypothetical protein